MSSSSKSPTQPKHDGRFTTTRWSVVVSAGKNPTPDTQKALATLCEAYWYPLYVYARRNGSQHDDASDLIQSFFANLLETNGFAIADRNRGKFRSFLLSALKNFAAKQWRRETTQKRGGAKPLLSIDYFSAEQRYLCEPEDNSTPDKIFERKWAIAILDGAMAKLTAEQIAAGKKDRFEVLKMYLGGETSRIPHAKLAENANMSVGAVKVAVHRLRKRYRELLRSEISQTVTETESIDDELQALFTALS